MAKRKHDPAGVSSGVNSIGRYVDEYTEYRAECHFCEAEDSTKDHARREYAKLLRDDGWRVIFSGELGVCGLACPECAKTPDEQRGED